MPVEPRKGGWEGKWRGRKKGNTVIFLELYLQTMFQPVKTNLKFKKFKVKEKNTKMECLCISTLQQMWLCHTLAISLQPSGSECNTSIVLITCDCFEIQCIWKKMTTFPLGYCLQSLSVFPLN